MLSSELDDFVPCITLVFARLLNWVSSPLLRPFIAVLEGPFFLFMYSDTEVSLTHGRCRDDHTD